MQVIESQTYWADCPNLKLLLEDVWCARQPSTVQLYCYSLRKFFAYCAIFNHDITLPVNSGLAASFISFTRHNSGTKGAVSSAINALKWLHNFVPGVNSHNDPLNEKILKLVVDSALRHLPKNTRTKKPLEHEFIESVVRCKKCIITRGSKRSPHNFSLIHSIISPRRNCTHIMCSSFSYTRRAQHSNSLVKNRCLQKWRQCASCKRESFLSVDEIYGDGWSVLGGCPLFIWPNY